MQARLVKLVGAIAVIGSCSASAADPTAGPPRSFNSTTIEVSGYQGPGYFLPAADTLYALANDSIGVTFQWTDPSDGHNIIWDAMPAGMSLLNVSTRTGGTYDFTLAVGTYFYHCGLHAEQTGSIIVYPPKPTM